MSDYHILFISSWYPNRNSPSHGIFNRAFVEAVALRSDVSVLHVSPDVLPCAADTVEVTKEESVFTVQVYYRKTSVKIPLLSKAIQHFRRLKAYRKGFEIILKEKGKPQLVQLNVLLPAGPGALMLCRRYKLPLVANECWTGYDPLDGRCRGMIQKIMTRGVFRQARVVMPVTDYLQRLMESHGLKGVYEVVPNVVDTKIFSPSPAKRMTGFRLIHISALDNFQKNVSGILDAFLLALKEGNIGADSELVIVGEGPDAAHLKKKSATLCREGSISFKGQLTPTQVANEINQSDALIMFSNYETFCVAVPEALACGKPVITSDAGGIMSYMNSRLGIVVPKGDVAQLATAITRMSTEHKNYDPDELRQFVTDRFRSEIVSQKLHSVYSRVLNGEW